MSSGTFNLSLGYNDEDVIRAVKKQIDKLVHCTSSFKVSSVESLQKKLLEENKRGFVSAFTKTCGGSVAIEGAIKHAMFNTGKNEVIAFRRSHHGQTFYSSGISGFAFRTEHHNLAKPPVHHVNYPCDSIDNYAELGVQTATQVMREIEDTILYNSQNKIAAIIIEPILGNGGGYVASKTFLQEIREFCSKQKICLIFDEIQTGIGRTGHLFACDYFNVYPDILVTAKGLGSGFQVSAMLCNHEYQRLPQNNNSFTYGSNPVAAAAAVAVLEKVSDKKFLETIRSKGAYIDLKLKAMQEKHHSLIKSYRGVGLMQGFTVLDNEFALFLQKELLDRKILIRLSAYDRGNFIKIRPPLIIEEKQIDHFFLVLNEILEKVK